MIEDLLAMKAMAQLAGGGGRPYPSDRDVESFRHIEGLKAGEKLRYLGGPQKTPGKGEVVTVYRVFETEERCGKEGTQIFRNDFSTLFECNNGDGAFILEYSQDSRYFERVTS